MKNLILALAILAAVGCGAPNQFGYREIPLLGALHDWQYKELKEHYDERAAQTRLEYAQRREFIGGVMQDAKQRAAQNGTSFAEELLKAREQADISGPRGPIDGNYAGQSTWRPNVQSFSTGNGGYVVYGGGRRIGTFIGH